MRTSHTYRYQHNFYIREKRDRTPRQRKEKIKVPRLIRGRKTIGDKAEGNEINHVSFTLGVPN